MAPQQLPPQLDPRPSRLILILTITLQVVGWLLILFAITYMSQVWWRPGTLGLGLLLTSYTIWMGAVMQSCMRALQMRTTHIITLWGEGHTPDETAPSGGSHRAIQGEGEETPQSP